MDNRRVFAFLSDCLTAGASAVLVTVIAVKGSSMRGPGTHMGVRGDGRFEGSLSGGCIENAVVAEALDALKAGQARIVRFGAGSPYIDIKLPCGGGLDIHFQPLQDTALITASLHAIEHRAPFSLELPLEGGDAEFTAGRRATGYSTPAGTATIGHWPEPKLLILGHGAGVTALARLARQIDLTVAVQSPDTALLAGLGDPEIMTHHLAAPADVAALDSDQWTAIIFLFHDHDWETALMVKALGQPHFYLGAMGGRKAHAVRVAALGHAGISDKQIASIHAPIGLFHSSRDPDTLALSALGQVIQAYHETDFTYDGE